MPMPMTTTPPTRCALRILTAIVTRPPAPGTRPCAAGLTPHDPPGPRATATVVVVLEPAGGGPGVLTLQTDLCDACAAALPPA